MDKREKARRSGARRTKMRRKAKQNKSSMVCITLLSLEDEQLRQDELKEREEYITTKEYIENIAKTKLGLVYPNEIIFKETEEAP